MTPSCSPSRLLGVLLLSGLGAAACKIEPIEDLQLTEERTESYPDRIIPPSAERSADARRQAQWDASLRRYLSFLGGPELGGRRPGSPGAALTVGLVISVLEGAGLSPNGPDLGWTQPVGVRVVETTGQVLTVHPAARPEETEPVVDQRFEEGLWLVHRGSAGERTMTVRLDEEDTVPAGTDPGTVASLPRERLRVLVPPPASYDPLAAFRETFDAAWRDGVDVAVLPFPDEAEAKAREIAERWRRPEVQSLMPGRDPPAALDLEGFVSPQVHQALLDARERPGSTADISFQTNERWFQDDNVIGRIAGGRRPEQAVLVIAPWDAGGLSGPDEPISADDAGALAVLLTVAETSGAWRREGRRPDRSLVFVAAAAGSLGHRGAQRFIEQSGIRPSNIVAVVNLEMLGGTGSDLLMFDGDRSDLGEVVTALDPTARSVPDEQQRHGHVPFLSRNVPAITLSRPPLPDQDGVLRPMSLHSLHADTELVFRLVWQLSDRPETGQLIEPPPTEPDEAAPAPAPAPAPSPSPEP